MAKLKLKLDDYEYIEGTPEELATFMKIVGKQQTYEAKTTEVKDVETEKEFKNVTTEEHDPIKKLENELEGVEIISLNLPKEDEVIEFITSKEHFEHNTIELQEKFLRKRLPVREDPTLYAAFDNIIRKARKHIANKYYGTWDNRETKSFGRRTHVTVYKFKKATDEQNPSLNSILQSELQPLIDTHMKAEPINNIIV